MESINTINGLIEHRARLSAWCETCLRTVQLDLDALGQRLGYDHSTMHHELTPKLKCSACGSRKIGLIVAGWKPTP